MNSGPFAKSVGQPLEDDLFDSADIFSKGIDLSPQEEENQGEGSRQPGQPGGGK